MSQEKIDKLGTAILGTFRSQFTPLYEEAGENFEEDLEYYKSRAWHIADLTISMGLETEESRIQQYKDALESEAVAAQNVAATRRLKLTQQAQDTVFKVIGAVAKLLVEATIGALLG